MIVLYTFDFQDNATKLQKNKQYMMLGVSIQSVLENLNSKIILVTTDNDVKRRVSYSFPTVKFELGINNDYCIGENFTCAGHARINHINNILHKHRDDVLYLDNDTLVYPNGLHIISQNRMPMGYCNEVWNSIGNWCQDENRAALVRNLFGKITDKSVINNGVQYFPINEKSLNMTDDIKKLYKRLVHETGYYWGMDQLVFSIVMNKYGFNENTLFKNQTTNTVWHAYYCKMAYIENLRKLGVYVDNDGNLHGYKDIYKKLEKRKEEALK